MSNKETASAEGFTLLEWTETKFTPFKAPDEVVEKLNELIRQASSLAKEHDIPFMAAYCSEDDGTRHAIQASHEFKTLGRLPVEFMACTYLCANGLINSAESNLMDDLYMGTIARAQNNGVLPKSH